MSNETNDENETPKQKRLRRQYMKLRKLADKAMNARYEFEKAFGKATCDSNEKQWKEMCDLMNIGVDSDSSDWMC